MCSSSPAPRRRARSRNSSFFVSQVVNISHFTLGLALRFPSFSLILSHFRPAIGQGRLSHGWLRRLSGCPSGWEDLAMAPCPEVRCSTLPCVGKKLCISAAPRRGEAIMRCLSSPRPSPQTCMNTDESADAPKRSHRSAHWARWAIAPPKSTSHVVFTTCVQTRVGFSRSLNPSRTQVHGLSMVKTDGRAERPSRRLRTQSD